MNKSKIDYTEHVWNPITGCLKKCSYCYVPGMCNRFAGDIRMNKGRTSEYRMKGDMYVLEQPMLNEAGKPIVYPFGFEPTYHAYRADTLDKLKMGTNIIVSSMGDMFGPWVARDIILDIFEECLKRPQHNYIFQTQYPERLYELGERSLLPAEPNFWYGTTVTGGDLKNVFRANQYKTFISFEPLREDPEIFEDSFNGIDWIIVGAETGRGKNKVKPAAEWISKIEFGAEYHSIPVFYRKSMVDFVENMRTEYPDKLLERRPSPKYDKNFNDSCGGCGKHMKKNEMVQMQAKHQRGEYPKLIGYICKDCYSQICDKYQLEDVTKNEPV